MSNQRSKILFTPTEAAQLYTFVTGGDGVFELHQFVLDKLYQILGPKMPYGTMKARTGDPDQWIADYFDSISVEEAIRFINEHSQPQ